MAEFYDPKEESLIEVFLDNDIYYWIGMNDFAIEGTYRWVETHEEPVAYSNWHTNQPDNGVHGSNNEDCVVKDHRFQGTWNDFVCSWKDHDSRPIYALCQKLKLSKMEK